METKKVFKQQQQVQMSNGGKTCIDTYKKEINAKQNKENKKGGGIHDQILTPGIIYSPPIQT